MTRARFDDRLFSALLFLSGASALIDEHILSRLLVRVVGSSSEAVACVLVAFMGGMGLGAALSARLVRRTRRPLALYGQAELCIALCAASLPLIISGLEGLHVWAAQALGAGSALFVVRFGLALGATALPAVAMGATLPLLLEGLRRRRLAGPHALPVPSPVPVARLYAANTAGAALGVLLSTYLLVPAFGLTSTLYLSALGNALAGLVTLVLSRRTSEGEEAVATPVALVGLQPDPVESAAPPPDPLVDDAPLRLKTALIFSAGTGLMAFALETVAFRLLAVVVGNSVYAFGLMLFVFLSGNAIGSHAASRVQRPSLLGLIVAQASVGLAVLLTVPLWDQMPGVFRLLGDRAPSFVLWEGARFAVTFALLVLPTLAMGFSFGLVLRLCAGTGPDVPTRVARLYAANMMGSISGALLGTFVLVPVLGSEATLTLLGLGEVSLIVLVMRRDLSDLIRLRRVGLSLALLALGVVFVSPPWNLARLMSGANVYFAEGFEAHDRLLTLKEDRSGGMVAVTETNGVRTMFANGKFEGNDGFEVPDQQMYALLPLLFVKHHGRAASIGLGTGNSLAVITAFPFEHIDAIELSPAIVDAAREHFQSVHRGSLDDPRVSIHLEDGRNFLRTATTPYDLIQVQISSIWISGAADLYSVEFYEDCKAAMTQGGVLQQWLQLHHISALDIGRIVGSMRGVFPHVTLWVAGHQGILLASKEPFQADAKTLRTWPETPAVALSLKTSNLAHPYSAFGHLYLDTPGIDALLRTLVAREGIEPEDLLSFDDWPVLEYSTPRGNLLRDAVGDNMALLRRHAMTDVLAFVEGLTDETEARMFLTYAALERGYRGLSRYIAGKDRDALRARAPDLVNALDQADPGQWP